MREKEMKNLVRNCLKEYYEEDKKILIDISTLQIVCITFFLYNLIFFGNKIIFAKETYDSILKESKKRPYNIKSEIGIKNAKYFIEAIERDERENYQIIDMQSYGKTKVQSIKNFLQRNPDSIFCLSDMSLYQTLKEEGLSSQLNYLEKGKQEESPFSSRVFKFETIGAIRFDGEKMIINKRAEILTKLFDKKGLEKDSKIKEVKPREYVLIRGTKEDKYSFNLYQIVSRHTRNHAIRIIWTELKIGQKTNKYIDRLPYQYRKMILDSVE